MTGTRDGARTRVRKGTKATQGINQDVAVHARASAAAALTLGDGDASPCPYSAHRSSDWRLAAGGPVVCGVCHPAPAGLDTV